MSQDKKTRVFIATPDVGTPEEFVELTHLVDLIEDILIKRGKRPLNWWVKTKERLNIAVDYYKSRIGDTDAVIFLFPDSSWKENDAYAHQEYQNKVIFETGLASTQLGIKRIFFLIPEEENSPYYIKPFGTSPNNISLFTYQSGELAHIGINNCIDAIEITLDQLNKQDIFPREGIQTGFFLDKLEGVEELMHEYTIEIQDKNGNSFITKKVEIQTNISGLKERTHEVYSNTSYQAFEELNLMAINEISGEELKYRKGIDTGNRKDFTIIFEKAIRKGTKVTYSYSYLWKKLFPLEDEENYFVTKPNSSSIKFNLIIPKSWPLEKEDIELIATKSENGTTTNKKLNIKEITIQKTSGRFKEFIIIPDKINGDLQEIQLKWFFDRKQNERDSATQKEQQTSKGTSAPFQQGTSTIPEELTMDIFEKIGRGKLEEAIAVLIEFYQQNNIPTKEAALQLLRGRLSRLSSRQTAGADRPEEIDTELNRIGLSLMTILLEK